MNLALILSSEMVSQQEPSFKSILNKNKLFQMAIIFFLDIESNSNRVLIMPPNLFK
jgi:hypothetical protein